MAWQREEISWDDFLKRIEEFVPVSGIARMYRPDSAQFFVNMPEDGRRALPWQWRRHIAETGDCQKYLVFKKAS